jgi:hypothetical protein
MSEKLTFSERAVRLADATEELRAIIDKRLVLVIAAVEAEAAAMKAANERFEAKRAKSAESKKA